jgi:peptidoglycan/LPS O-acetylase OafA/YrhL
LLGVLENMEIKTIGSCSQEAKNNFTVLRLIAALLVIYGHCYPIVGSGHPDLILQLVNSRYAGAIAVDVFFVISGFLIAASWERNSVPAFFAARILRIYPALIVCVGLSVFVLGALITKDANYFSQPETWKYFTHNATLRATEYFLPGVFQDNPDKAINGSIWSLPLEVRLYVLVAILGACALLKEGRYFVFCVALGVAYFFTNMHQPENVPSHNTLNSAAFFLTGIFFWLYRKSIILSAPLLALCIIVAVATNGTKQFSYAYLLVIAYGTFYLVYIPKIKLDLKKDLSYGVYLYGWPVQQLVVYFVPDCSAEFNAIAAMAIVLVLAYCSWEFIESPALALRKKINFLR